MGVSISRPVQAIKVFVPVDVRNSGFLPGKVIFWIKDLFILHSCDTTGAKVVDVVHVTAGEVPNVRI